MNIVTDFFRTQSFFYFFFFYFYLYFDSILVRTGIQTVQSKLVGSLFETTSVFFCIMMPLYTQAFYWIEHPLRENVYHRAEKRLFQSSVYDYSHVHPFLLSE